MRSSPLPPPLARGARVALVAPAGPLKNPGELSASITHARALGWEPVPGKHALARFGYLAGTDAERLDDLNTALRDDSIDAVWCLRGGYGVMRILDGVDYDALRRRPRTILGYSDLTALHAAIGLRSQLVTYHGPTARGALSTFSRASLERAVVEQEDSCGTAIGARTLRGGRAEGRLVGGNLALLCALAGTPYAPDYRGAILVLEDVGEATYRIDRMLTQLRLAGALSQLAGIAYGHFTDGTDPQGASSRPLDDVLRETADAANVPAVAGVPVGHIDEQWTIPLGARAELDADAGILNVLLD
jgi:muramoyltetrapeptide carboxypeptidase